jgi:hypothetical protein
LSFQATESCTTHIKTFNVSYIKSHKQILTNPQRKPCRSSARTLLDTVRSARCLPYALLQDALSWQDDHVRRCYLHSRVQSIRVLRLLFTCSSCRRRHKQQVVKNRGRKPQTILQCPKDVRSIVSLFGDLFSRLRCISGSSLQRSMRRWLPRAVE